MNTKEFEKRCNELFFQVNEKTERIAELENENAELKSGCGMCYRKDKEQLTKAKEIIKQLLLLPYANNEEVYADVTSYLDEAEQFLSEVDK